MTPTITILSVNPAGERVSAAAARLSTSPGGVADAYAASSDAAKNRRLIGKVLSSGHASILEHIALSLAVCASAAAEQFFIEFRLASFTVKSRRYVDFSAAEYYTPLVCGDGLAERYHALYKTAFAAYAELTAAGVPKEDARFVLPYGFQSDFYVTLNARELLLVLSRMGASAELTSLRGQLLNQLETMCPAAYDAYKPGEPWQAPALPPSMSGKPAELLQAPQDAAAILAAAGGADCAALVAAPRPRALEHLTYTFRFNGLSLAGITHLARHRVQSLSVPSIASADASRYVVPASIPESLLPRYNAAFAASAALLADMPAEARQYAALSGHTLDTLSTMNARELLLFLRLRTCARAQWEIRGFAKALLAALRESCPPLFNLYGPGCFVFGKCPEGRMSCGRMAGVREEYKA